MHRSASTLRLRGDVLLSQFVHEFAVFHTFFPDGRIDTGDPQER